MNRFLQHKIRVLGFGQKLSDYVGLINLDLDSAGDSLLMHRRQMSFECFARRRKWRVAAVSRRGCVSCVEKELSVCELQRVQNSLLRNGIIHCPLSVEINSLLRSLSSNRQHSEINDCLQDYREDY